MLQQNRNIEEGMTNKTVYLANISFQVIEAELRPLFSRAEGVMSVRISQDRQTRKVERDCVLGDVYPMGRMGEPPAYSTTLISWGKTCWSKRQP